MVFRVKSTRGSGSRVSEAEGEDFDVLSRVGVSWAPATINESINWASGEAMPYREACVEHHTRNEQRRAF